MLNVSGPNLPEVPLSQDKKWIIKWKYGELFFFLVVLAFLLLLIMGYCQSSMFDKYSHCKVGAEMTFECADHDKDSDK